MGELVPGTPAPRLATAASIPLGLVSVASLLARAAPGSGLDPRLIEARAGLPAAFRNGLDLLHGFSGRRMYYPEEPAMRFEPLRPDRAGAGFEDFRAFLEQSEPNAYLAMAVHAVRRIHGERRLPFPEPKPDDREWWRTVLPPALTTVPLDAAIDLLASPNTLKRRTVDLFVGVWNEVYRDLVAANRSTFEQAVRLGRVVARGDAAGAFTELTGHRPPDTIPVGADRVQAVTFCPSPHLGDFVSYVLYPPDLIVFFDPTTFLARAAPEERAGDLPRSPEPSTAPNLDPDQLLDVARALADPTRLRVIDLLCGGELYAQEIVGRLGIAQSAVSRHLAQLERSGLVEVRAERGAKYYAVDPNRFRAVAAAMLERADAGAAASRS